MLLIDTRDRLAEDSRYAEDVDDRFVKGPDGEMQRADASNVRAGPGNPGRKTA